MEREKDNAWRRFVGLKKSDTESVWGKCFEMSLLMKGLYFVKY